MSDREPEPILHIPNMLGDNITAARALLAELEALADPVQRAADVLCEALLDGRELLCCGNGGSAADSAHFTAEIAGRYKLARRGFPAIDLTDQHALISALINDYPPEQVFARAVDALGQAGDVLVAISTSGNSENVRRALEHAGAHGLRTIALLGHDGGACKGLAEVELIVNHDTTARIQEAHLLLYHTICEALDPVLARTRPER